MAVCSCRELNALSADPHKLIVCDHCLRMPLPGEVPAAAAAACDGVVHQVARRSFDDGISSCRGQFRVVVEASQDSSSHQPVVPLRNPLISRLIDEEKESYHKPVDRLQVPLGDGTPSMRVPPRNEGTASMRLRGADIVDAVSRGDSQKIDKILEGGRKITVLHRSQAVIIAVEKGDLVSLIKLLANGEIDPHERGRAFLKAVKKKALDFVEKLYDKEIADFYFNKSVEEAAIANELPLLDKLLGYRKISEHARGVIVCSAAKAGSHEAITHLLADGSISEEDRGKAVGIGALQGCYHVVDVLLTRWVFFSEADRGVAVINAVKADANNVAIINRLLNTGTISRIDRDAASALAHEKALEIVVARLSRKGVITEEASPCCCVIL